MSGAVEKRKGGVWGTFAFPESEFSLAPPGSPTPACLREEDLVARSPSWPTTSSAVGSAVLQSPEDMRSTESGQDDRSSLEAFVVGKHGVDPIAVACVGTAAMPAAAAPPGAMDHPAPAFQTAPANAFEHGTMASVVAVDGSVAYMAPLQPVTTIRISCIPAGRTCSSLKKFLDDSGLAGTYDLCFLAPDETGPGSSVTTSHAIINFVNANFAYMCHELFGRCPNEGIVSVAPMQGLAASLQCLGLCPTPWSPADQQRASADSHLTPQDWAEGAAQQAAAWDARQPSTAPAAGVGGGFEFEAMQAGDDYSEEDPSPFRHTKMCIAFLRRGECKAGTSCRFAHSSDDLRPPPDLTKTRLCHRFIRGQCRGSCRFAHGLEELRSTGQFYKTAPCRWWDRGRCRAGGACRFAHGHEELRATPGSQHWVQQPLPPGLVSGPPACLAPLPPWVQGAQPNMPIDAFSYAYASMEQPNVEQEATEVVGPDGDLESFADQDESDDLWPTHSYHGPFFVMQERKTFMEVFVDDGSGTKQSLRRSRSEGDIHALSTAPIVS